jgi:hypothetical protein
VPHSVVYAASALPIKLPQNFHGQFCGTCRGVKVGIHGLLNWTAENLYLGLSQTKKKKKKKRIK